jgi:ABC-type phosphate transport system permease subunit
MISLFNILFISTISLAAVNSGFFIFSSSEIYSLKDGISTENYCVDYFHYCLAITGSFLLSLVVVIFFLCCNSICSITLYGVNCFIIVSLFIDKLIRKKYLCNEDCNNNCEDLIQFGNHLEKFSYGNISVIGITILVMVISLIIKICGKKE